MRLCLSVFLLIFTASYLYAGDPDAAQLHLLQAESYVQKGSLFAAVEEYRQAIELGIEDADVHQQLSILLYHQGFVDEAIDVMERAIEIDTDTDYLHHELGLLYFARSRWDEALDQFLASLKINPGQTDSHYYLAQLFKRRKNMVAARLFARSAKKLGHPAQEIDQIFKLADFSGEKSIWMEDGDKIFLRQILTDSRPVADDILARIAAGEAFELFARDLSYGGNRHRGGYAGGFSPRDLHPEIVSALTFVRNLSPAVIIELETGVNIIQKMVPLDWPYIESLISSDGVKEDQPVVATEWEKGDESDKGAVAEPVQEKTGAAVGGAGNVAGHSPAEIDLGSQSDQAMKPELEKNPEPVIESDPVQPVVLNKEKVIDQVPIVKEKIAANKQENPAEQVEKEGNEQTGADAVEIKPEPVVKDQSIISSGQPTLFFKMPKRPASPAMRFLVQVGAFREKWYAEKRVEKLKKLGYDSYLKEEARNKKRWFIAIASAYGTYGEAHSVVNDLKAKGIDAFVLKKR